jgi:hypothetical protein
MEGIFCIIGVIAAVPLEFYTDTVIDDPIDFASQRHYIPLTAVFGGVKLIIPVRLCKGQLDLLNRILVIKCGLGKSGNHERNEHSSQEDNLAIHNRFFNRGLKVLKNTGVFLNYSNHDSKGPV